ncbi:glycosyltransferase involved in cell wall biosynthesis [Homoserinimonas aerilata]|uniref:Glycosyltransferase involved in cell wall biosynthesis n=1 Tax=Homoserinimonas aerilata TaxID=1162970 RepID=A0A542YKL9_9MICO|nr:glycosyltransferase family 2 protein [Homoserinimonas aerilata]TQL48637.1 glycosyltransferase involved in cell wall biosynthesis [Homoserinimonas aerilata]
MVTISVALCTFNGARFVEQQLRSILDQSLMPREVIVADDGSTDATLELVRAVHEQYGDGVELRVLPSERNLGVTANFERAVRACTGEFVALSDQDDVWHRDRLATAAAALDADPALLLHHGNARLVDAEGHPLGVSLLDALSVSAGEREQIASGHAFDALVRRNLVTGATVMFRRELLEHALPFPSEWVHDEWLAIVAAAVGGVRLDDAEIIDYRQHGGNQIGAQKPTLRYRIGRMLEPRGDRYTRLAARAGALAGRIDALPTSNHNRQLAHDRARFDELRATLPASRPARLRTVVHEWRAGSYAALSSQGNLDVVRDLLQPA